MASESATCSWRARCLSLVLPSTCWKDERCRKKKRCAELDGGRRTFHTAARLWPRRLLLRGFGAARRPRVRAAELHGRDCELRQRGGPGIAVGCLRWRGQANGAEAHRHREVAHGRFSGPGRHGVQTVAVLVRALCSLKQIVLSISLPRALYGCCFWEFSRLRMMHFETVMRRIRPWQVCHPVVKHVPQYQQLRNSAAIAVFFSSLCGLCMSFLLLLLT